MAEITEHPLRVLHFPTDVGGNPGGLAAAERRLGLQSAVAVLHKSWIDYPVDIDLDLGSVGRWRRLGGRMRFSLRAMRDFDVIHFNFGQSLLPQLRGAGIDLPLLRAAGKRLFMTFQGCDARRTGFCRANFTVSCCGHASGDGLCTVEQDADKARTAAWASRCCHHGSGRRKGFRTVLRELRTPRSLQGLRRPFRYFRNSGRGSERDVRQLEG